jgi:GMP synthase-like glutamine amidotransferase
LYLKMAYELSVQSAERLISIMKFAIKRTAQMTRTINATTVLRHVAYEDLGSLHSSISALSQMLAMYEAPAHNLDALQFDSADLLIVLGGPIGAFEDHRYPFLKAELRVIERAFLAGSRVLGICLGAQLMARVLGELWLVGHASELATAGIGTTRFPMGLRCRR